MRWTRWLLSLAVSGVAAAALAACGGNSKDAPGAGLDTGIDPDKPLGEVSDAEAVQACNRLGSALEQRLPGDYISRQTCILLAAGSASSPSQCNAARDQCVQSSGISTDVYDPADCEGTDADGLQGCTATVGELETCTDEYTNELKALLDRLSCDNAGTPRANDVTIATFIAYRLPELCQSVQERCPNAPIFNVGDVLAGGT